MIQNQSSLFVTALNISYLPELYLTNKLEYIEIDRRFTDFNIFFNIYFMIQNQSSHFVTALNISNLPELYLINKLEYIEIDRRFTDFNKKYSRLNIA